MKDWGEIAPPPEGAEGRRVTIKELGPEPFEVHSAKAHKSDYHEGYYAIVNVQRDGEQMYFITSSTVLLEQLDQASGEMPFTARITRRKRYYTFVTGKEPEEPQCEQSS